MAEYTYTGEQTVAQNGNVLFNETAVNGSNCIKHREGSGIITLRGITNQCRARFFIDFSANIAILHIAKLNGRICGAKRSHSVSEQSNCCQSM